MAKKRKKQSVNRENLTPLMKLKLNQEIKSTELRLSGDALDSFLKLSQSDKRDVVLKVSQKAAETAVNDEIVDYFKRLNPAS